MPSKYIATETTEYEDGSKTVEDTFQKEDGTLFVNTYNVNSDGTKHDHAAVDENGRYLGGHSEDERPWVDKHLLMQSLSGLSFFELQTVEAKSTNEYVKQSARYFMQRLEMPTPENSSKLTRKKQFYI